MNTQEVCEKWGLPTVLWCEADALYGEDGMGLGNCVMEAYKDVANYLAYGDGLNTEGYADDPETQAWSQEMWAEGGIFMNIANELERRVRDGDDEEGDRAIEEYAAAAKVIAALAEMPY